MMKLSKSAVVVLVLLASLAICGSAQAQSPYCGWGLNPYPADFTSLYQVERIPTPPYFALHPPVYYSHIVPRTYGYSPYAYMPMVQTPQVEIPTPEVIENQYVPKPTGSEPTVEPAKDQTAAAPQVIDNPFATVSLADGEHQVL